MTRSGNSPKEAVTLPSVFCESDYGQANAAFHFDRCAFGLRRADDAKQEQI
jgi:hypothetical protein